MPKTESTMTDSEWQLFCFFADLYAASAKKQRHWLREIAIAFVYALLFGLLLGGFVFLKAMHTQQTVPLDPLMMIPISFGLVFVPVLLLSWRDVSLRRQADQRMSVTLDVDKQERTAIRIVDTVNNVVEEETGYQLELATTGTLRLEKSRLYLFFAKSVPDSGATISVNWGEHLSLIQSSFSQIILHLETTTSGVPIEATAVFSQTPNLGPDAALAAKLSDRRN